MHIPDGIVGPECTATALAVMAPAWWLAARRVRRMDSRSVPAVALGAAFCFTVMLFNIPAPGGTTAHPVAGTLLAVMLGPYAAVIGVSAALAVQALLFGDGGLLAYPLNCLAMALVLPVTGWLVYRLAAGHSAAASRRRAAAAGAGAYLGISLAAGLVGLVLGVQPLLHHTASGRPIYFPFGLGVTMPAMLGAHLLVAGPAEAALTYLSVRALQLAGAPLYGVGGVVGRDRPGRRVLQGAAAGLALLVAGLVLLSPLGNLANGAAFGEDSPAGADAYRGVPGLKNYGQGEPVRSPVRYIASSVVGVGAILLLVAGGMGLAGAGRPRAWEIPSPAISENRQMPDGTGYGVSGLQAGGMAASRAALPSWLTAAPALPNAPVAGRSRVERWLERSIASVAGTAVSTLRGEDWARRDGYLQRLDARARLVGCLALIAAASFSQSAPALLGLLCLAITVSAASRLPLYTALLRIAPFCVLLGLAVALPSSFTANPGHSALLVVWRRPAIGVTAASLYGAGMLLGRVVTAAALAAALSMSSGLTGLTAGLRGLPVPAFAREVLALTLRYIGLLSQCASDLLLARRSRIAGRCRAKVSGRLAASAAAALYLRSAALAQGVHEAMQSRGLAAGDLPASGRQPQWSAGDTRWVALAGSILALTAAMGRTHAGF